MVHTEWRPCHLGPSASTGNVLQVEILESYPRFTESETGDEAQEFVLSKNELDAQ